MSFPTPQPTLTGKPAPDRRELLATPPRDSSRDTPDTTTVGEDPTLEMPEAQPVPLEPEVVVVPCPGAPAPDKEDSDCQIVEDPPTSFKSKTGWARKKIEQTKKTLVLHIPRVDESTIKREEPEAPQKEDSPALQAGANPGNSEAEPDSGNASLDEQ